LFEINSQIAKEIQFTLTILIFKPIHEKQLNFKIRSWEQVPNRSRVRRLKKLNRHIFKIMQDIKMIVVGDNELKRKTYLQLGKDEFMIEDEPGLFQEV
jgi:hypothetical protein